ncbi:MAG: FHA domain-containing protein [Planctomycetes bacterium]|nr:FHA domain-containing protein [Planctomycetota bacterium]
MILCPFCHFQNEDGALFCEQCKSDLSGVPETPAANPLVTAPLTPEPAVAQPVAAVPISVEPVAVPLIEPEPVQAEPLPAEPYPLTAEPAAPVMEAMPIEAMPVEAVPVETEAWSPAAGMSETQAPPPVAEPAVPHAPPPPPPKVEAPPPPPAKVETPPSAPKVEAPPAEPVLPKGAEPRLLVLRGQRRNVEYPIYEGLNFIGRADEKPVDIDLEDQEPPDRIWCSRQHALVSLEEGKLVLEDLNSANGTYLNRNRVYPGQKQPLKVNDIIQIGNVQLKVIV